MSLQSGRIVGITPIQSLADAADQAVVAWTNLLAIMAELDERHYPPREERTPGWKANFQVRCEGCGRFASILRSGDGFNSQDGTYDPWFEVECKRCGVGDGYIAAE